MMTDKDMAVAAATMRSESPATWKSRLKQAARAYTVPTSRLRPLPEFLIIGAQRTGTTSLYKYLSEHPQFRSATLKTKGVHFFDTRYEKGMAWYRAHFPTSAYRAAFRVRHGADLVTGEASPYYLFHPHVPFRLAQHLPDVKLIAMLRDPIERTYSQWQHELSRGFEHLDRFEDALDAEPGRLAGEVEKMNADPDYKSFSHQHHSYMARSRYADQIDVYRSLFPASQMHFVRAEDFFADPGVEYAKVLEFLGLPAHSLGDYKKHNGYKRTPMDPATRRRLEQHFADSNARLEKLLGSHFTWGE
ncbi:MAG TPA: sulfotransferase [Acidimicrobiia bacterium]|nr:sulfotransferase [Acidimicrobiia bacterium]